VTARAKSRRQFSNARAWIGDFHHVHRLIRMNEPRTVREAVLAARPDAKPDEVDRLLVRIAARFWVGPGTAALEVLLKLGVTKPPRRWKEAA
jgi:hypothetical protein